MYSHHLIRRYFDPRCSHCTSDYIAVYSGPTTSSPLLKMLCGKEKTSLMYDGQELLVEFRYAQSIQLIGTRYKNGRSFSYSFIVNSDTSSSSPACLKEVFIVLQNRSRGTALRLQWLRRDAEFYRDDNGSADDDCYRQCE